MDIKNNLITFKDNLLKKIGVLNEEAVDQHNLEELEETEELDPEYLAALKDNLNKDDVEFLQEETALFKKGHENWKISKNPLLIIGDTGTGVSKFIRENSKTLDNPLVLDGKKLILGRKDFIDQLSQLFNIENATNFNQIKEQLGEKEKIVVLENIERLFLRKIGGFELLEDFLLFLHGTKHVIYWIVSINRYSYNYLDRVKGFSSNFLSYISISSLEEGEIQDKIISINGDNIVTYLKPKDMGSKKSNNLSQLSREQRQEELKADFFKRMYAFADGNLQASINYWLKSVVRSRDKKIYVRAHEINANLNLSLDELFVLEAILQHRRLSTQSLKEVLRNTTNSYLLMLENLEEKGLVTSANYGYGKNFYEINNIYLKWVKNRIRDQLNRKL